MFKQPSLLKLWGVRSWRAAASGRCIAHSLSQHQPLQPTAWFKTQSHPPQSKPDVTSTLPGEASSPHNPKCILVMAGHKLDPSILRISLISAQHPTDSSSSLCYDETWLLTVVVLKNKSFVSRHCFSYLTKGWKEWGDENITDTSESVLKMFSFLRENVHRPHCPQCEFHCLEPPQVYFSYIWWDKVKFLPRGFMLFQSALISDHSCSLSPHLPRRQSQMGPCSPYSLVYSGKNQFDNSVTGRNFSLRLGSIFSHQGAASNASRIRAAAHIWAGVTRSCCYCPDELFFPFAQVILN